MWRSIPSMLLLSNSCFSQSLPPSAIVPPSATIGQSPGNEGQIFTPAGNEGQIISFGVEFGLPYDLTTALENPLGRALTAISVAAGELAFDCVF